MQRYDRDREQRNFRGRDNEQRQQSYRSDERWDAHSDERDDDAASARYSYPGQWRETYAADEREARYRDEATRRYQDRTVQPYAAQDRGYDDERGGYAAGREYTGGYGARYAESSRQPYGAHTRPGWSAEPERQGHSGRDPYSAHPRAPQYGGRQYSGYGPSPRQDYDSSGQAYVGGYGSDLGYGSSQRPAFATARDGDYTYSGAPQAGGYGQGGTASSPYGSYGGMRETGYARDAYGSHADPGRNLRGRGPKNYLRSDERIREDLCERLADDPWVDASDITVEVKNGLVTLSGSVGERHVKHRAEDIADRCSGVKEVENRLSVQRAGTRNAGNPNAAGTGTAAGSVSATRSEDTLKKH